MKEMASKAASKSVEERTYTEKYALSKIQSYKDVSRRCSYCSEASHTRKTCKVFASHVETRNSLEIRWRRGIAKFIAESPIKIGSFVEWDSWDGKKTQAILTGINYKELNGIFATNQLMSGNDVGKDWFLYTILNTDSTNWWGPKSGEIFACTVPFKVNGEFFFDIKKDPFYTGTPETRYYSSQMVNILSEGEGKIEVSEEWINKVDASTFVKQQKHIDTARIGRLLSTFEQSLVALGF